MLFDFAEESAVNPWEPSGPFCMIFDIWMLRCILFFKNASIFFYIVWKQRRPNAIYWITTKVYNSLWLGRISFWSLFYFLHDCVMRMGFCVFFCFHFIFNKNLYESIFKLFSPNRIVRDRESFQRVDICYHMLLGSFE